MFTSEFKEKDNSELPLPGKKASEIKEVLLLIYPSVKETPITEENCYFLVKLAHEYQMEAIITRCEDIMVDNVNTINYYVDRKKSKVKPQKSVVAKLVFAQTYDLEKLKVASVRQAQCLSLEELKQDSLCDQIQPESLKEIIPID